MKNTELHPVELLILAAVLVASAVLTLAVHAVALVGALLPQPPRSQRGDSSPVAIAPPQPSLEQRVSANPVPDAAELAGASVERTPPAAHPLAQLATAAAEQLEALPVAQLRRRARASGLPRSLSHKGRRGPLLEALAGLEVAMA